MRRQTETETSPCHREMERRRTRSTCGASLMGAIAEASVRAKELVIDSPFRDLVRDARAMHDLLVEGFVANEPLQAEYASGLRILAECDRALEVLATMPDGKLQRCAGANLNARTIRPNDAIE